MSKWEVIDDPPFRSEMRATSGGEVWTHTRDDFKMKEYGWRCTNNENSYELGTLIANWCEQRRDLEQLRIPECLPSQYWKFLKGVVWRHGLYQRPHTILSFKTTKTKLHSRVTKACTKKYAHYYSPEYHTRYNSLPVKTVPEEIRNLQGRHPHSHPAHQPELDGEQLKAIYNSWKTTYRADYLPPALRKGPLIYTQHWARSHSQR